MKIFLKKYHFNLIVYELILSICILFFVFTFIYFFYLKNTITYFFQLNLRFNQLKQELTSQTVLFLKHKNIQDNLQKWSNQHKNFYQQISFTYSCDQWFQRIITIIKKSHFSIIQIKSKCDPNQSVQAKLTGKFQNIFLLISALNHFPMPIYVDHLKMTRSTLYLTLKGNGKCLNG